MADLGSIDRKVEWAEERVGDLETELGDFARSDAYKVVAQEHPDDPKRGQVVLRVYKPIPDQVALRVGDIIHNLRSALDHLAYRAMGGLAGDQTAFPIWRKPRTPTANEVKSTVMGKVKGAPTPILKEFLALEPYEGGNDEMLWCIDALDIVDKHRLMLSALATYESVNIDFGARLQAAFADNPMFAGGVPSLVMGLVPETRFPLEDGYVLFEDLAEHITESDPTFTIEVSLGEPKPLEGQPIKAVLPKLVEATTRTIDIFRPLL